MAQAATDARSRAEIEREFTALQLDGVAASFRTGPAAKVILRLIWNLRRAWGEAEFMRRERDRLVEERASMCSAKELLDRMPPANDDAERGVLGAALILQTTRGIELDASDFYWESNRILWEHMTAMTDAGTPLDSLTLRARLKQAGQWDEFGGAYELAVILQSCPTTANVGHYVKIVKHAAGRRAKLSGLIEQLKGVWG